MPRSKINYVDLQLRNMDWQNLYGSNNAAKFQDDEHKIYHKSLWRRRIRKAVVEVSRDFEKEGKESKKIKQSAVSEDEVVIKLYRLFENQLKREKKFLNFSIANNEVENTIENKAILNQLQSSYGVAISRLEDLLKGKRKDLLMGDEIASAKSLLNTAKSYGQAFSNYINILTTATGDGDPIPKLLRDKEFINQMAGKYSKISSKAIAKQAYNKATGKNDGVPVKEFYEDLFGVFFGLSISHGDVEKIKSKGISVQKEKDLLKDMKKEEKAAFIKRFQEFMRKYFHEADGDFSKQLRNLTAVKMKGAIFDQIYKDFTGNRDNRIVKLGSSSRINGGEKGVTEANEKQLKEMLKELLRQLQDKKEGIQDFNIPGLVDIHADYKTSGNSAYLSLQTDIEAAREDENTSPTNLTYKKLRDDFVALLVEQLIIQGQKTDKNFKINGEQKKRLMDAAFEKYTDKTRAKTAYKNGKEVLDAMSAYGPAQMTGLLGEIATAYELGKAFSTTVATTGASKNNGSQSHYDVLLSLGGMGNRIGFQVKQYSKTSATIYSDDGFTPTSRQMEKYYPSKIVDDIRFLTANGKFLTEVANFPGNLYEDKNNILSSIRDVSLPHLGSFLRITDNVNDIANSDVYVISGKYIPSSYLVTIMIEKYITYKRENKDVLSVEGKFPNYTDKAAPAEGESREDRIANYVWIDNILNKLKTISIQFHGITIDTNGF